MRIAMLHWAFPPVIGGVESHLATLAPALVGRGAEVCLLVGSVCGRHERGVWRGVYLERTPLMDLNHLRDMDLDQAAPAIRREIEQFLGEAKPDVVHAHNMHYFSPVHLEVLADWCRRSGVPLVLTAHNVWEDDLWRRMAAKANSWDAVVAVSHFIARELEASGFNGHRIAVIHHGLDTERFRPASPSKRRAIRHRYPGLAGRRIIFHPARASIAKGSLVAVEALAAIRRSMPDALLVCAGAGPIVDWGNLQGTELEEIRQAVHRHGLEDAVIIRSFPWEEMVDLYQVADVTIYPSIFEEPFGLAVLEAMACGSPVVVSRSGGMPEFVEDGVTGFVVPQRDAEALAERCMELLRHPRRAAAMARQARQAVLARHTVAEMASRTWRVYEWAMGLGRAA